jgi:hypothetical protein
MREFFELSLILIHAVLNFVSALLSLLLVLTPGCKSSSSISPPLLQQQQQQQLILFLGFRHAALLGCACSYRLSPLAWHSDAVASSCCWVSVARATSEFPLFTLLIMLELRRQRWASGLH